ncbi:MAG: hypothetical protein A2846_03860 [Candidatus Doudnabacteria bacterium RIFCSPHIGHO2_01_FULL_49_9]|uniref:Septum formation initiator n=1 Tax=Candidatus Doudnabacteria bacterium RIFCSPHIGHO2_01_FULL_49_9 TaxID=1817827 RepID=A0A1F5P3Z3_9BACT|nr:MAG: hypothetical protein A2846_03860 [Candidatus Doudnabacteria bacterium RIFCSPHIGHO2_01_FULL_49_9]
MLSGILKSKLWLVVGSTLLALTAFYLARETYQKWQIDTEVEKLQDEIVAVEGQNKEILELINYYKTTEYKERQARSILGLAKPGEFVVTLPPRKEQAAGDSAQMDSKTHLQEWWEYFFSASRK